MRVSLVTPVTFFGGAKGGGKSYLVRAREVYRRLKYPKSKGLIVRKSYPELLSNHIRKFFEEYPQVREWYNKAEKTIYWPNSSTTEFSYLLNTDDVYTYQGREYEDISVDEVTQHEWEVIRVLRSSNRTTLTDIKPSMFLTGNPGGVGHSEVKRIFVDRDFRDGENPQDFAFVQAFVRDNQALTVADPEYIKRLEDLPELLRKAYLEGSWDIFMGQAFSELSPEVHLIDPYEISDSYRCFGAYDHGFNHPFSFGVFAVDYDGNVDLVRFVTSRLKRVDEIALLLKDSFPIDKLEYIVAGTDCWTRQRDGGPSVQEQFFDHGINLTKAKIDRVQGSHQVRSFLAWKGIRLVDDKLSDGEPKFRIFSSCKPVYYTLSRMIFDPSKPEDVLKVDADSEGIGGDDDYDMVRYGLMSRPMAAEFMRQKPKKNTSDELREWIRRKEQLHKVERW